MVNAHHKGPVAADGQNYPAGNTADRSHHYQDYL